MIAVDGGRSTRTLVQWAVAVAMVGAAVIGSYVVTQGVPMQDSLRLVAMAGGAALLGTVASTVLLTRLRGASLASQLAVVTVVPLLTVLAGTGVGARAMFISAHDLTAVAVLLLAAGTAGVAAALVLGARVAGTSHELRLAAMELANGRRPSAPTSEGTRELTHLHHELESAAMQLTEARDRERAMESSRRELISWVSHDLRTPLAGIRALAEALEDGITHDPETVQRYHRIIRMESDRLAALVDDLFELSRVQAGVITMEWDAVSLRDLVSDALAGVSPVAAAKGVRVDGRIDDGMPDVVVSPPELLRALRNVLENAVRHTPADGSVVVEAGRRDDAVYLVVQDNGGGIPSSQPRAGVRGRLPRRCRAGPRRRCRPRPRHRQGAGRGARRKHLGREPRRRRSVHDQPADETARRIRTLMRILVTGGAGFVGSHVVDALIGQGHSVSVLDLLHPDAHADVPAYCNPAADHTWGDVCDRDLLDRLLVGVDAVCHQAAKVGLGVDFADAPEYVRHNDAGTSSLLAGCHDAGFAGRMVLASSMVVYGEGRYRCHIHGDVRPAPRRLEDLRQARWEPLCPRCGDPLSPEPVAEDAALDPRNVYAATKVHQEHLAACYAREHPRTDVVALRYHNVYGPRMPNGSPYAGVASLFRSALQEHRPPRVFEDGRQLRDFVHVRDVAAANVLALEGAGRPGFVAYNVASGEPRTVGEMARVLASAFGDPALEPVVEPEFRLGDVRHVVGSIALARADLGYTPQVGFVEGVTAFAVDDLRSPLPAPTS